MARWPYSLPASSHRSTFVPLTAGALGMPPLFHTVNIPAILLWASAHVLPGALAISALHHYGGLPHNFGKLIWFSAVIVIAAIIGAATWWRYRRRGFKHVGHRG